MYIGTWEAGAVHVIAREQASRRRPAQRGPRDGERLTGDGD